MPSRSKKNIRVDTMETSTKEDSIKEATKEAKEEDMEGEEEEDMVVEEDHLPVLIVER
jgi:hypothetical protein